MKTLKDQITVGELIDELSAHDRSLPIQVEDAPLIRSVPELVLNQRLVLTERTEELECAPDCCSGIQRTDYLSLSTTDDI